MKNPVLTLIKDNIQSIRASQDSVEAMNVRKAVFVPKQRIAVLRTWFKFLNEVILTDEELKIVKSIIVKPKSTEVEIVGTIIRWQLQLKNNELIDWFNQVKPKDQKDVAMQIIIDKRVTDENIKMKLFKDFLKHRYYQYQTIDLLERFIAEASLGNMWDQLFDYIVDVINNGDDRELSERLANYWHKRSKLLNTYASKKDIISPLLYELTKRDHFLSQAAIDTFLF